MKAVRDDDDPGTSAPPGFGGACIITVFFGPCSPAGAAPGVGEKTVRPGESGESGGEDELMAALLRG